MWTRKLYTVDDDDDDDHDRENLSRRRTKMNSDFSDDDDDDDNDDSENEGVESSISSELVRYESDRGSEGEEETYYDEENPYHPRLPKRRKRSHYHDQTVSNEPDRISSLSEPLLLHILSFLPIKDAVRTGTLSRKLGSDP